MKWVNLIIKNKKKLYGMLSVALIVPPIATATALIVETQDQKKYFVFDNYAFETMDQLYNYVKQKTEVDEFSAPVKNWFIDGNLFTSYTSFKQYLEDKFALNESSKIRTYNNPFDYQINPAGELSNLVVNNDTNKLVTVYEGSNGVAYKNRQDALNSLKKGYDKVYQVLGTVDEKDENGNAKIWEFNNYQDTYQYLKDIYLNKLKDEKSKMLYNNGLWESKEQIIKEINQNLKPGFKYNQQIFSDYNYSDFLNFFSDLRLNDPDLINDNIKTIKNANYNSYWLDLDDSRGLNEGLFAGPRYIETPLKFNGLLYGNWNEIDSFQPDLITSIAGLGVLSETINQNYYVRNNQFDWSDRTSSSKLTFYNFLISLKNKNIIDDNLIQQFNTSLFKGIDPTDPNLSFKDNLVASLVAESANQLNEINSSSFNDVHKLMVFIQRMLQYISLYPELNSDKENLAQIKNSFQKLSYLVFTNYLKDDQTNDLFDLKENLKDLPVEVLINLILDPNKFYKSQDYYVGAMNTIKNVNGWLNTINKDLKFASSAYKTFKKAATSSNQNAAKLNEDLKQGRVESKKEVEKNQDQILTDLGLNQPQANNMFVGALMAIIGFVSLALDANNLLGFVDFKTLEYKIDEQNSIYYFVTVPHFKFLNINFDYQQPEVPVIKLVGSLIDMVLPMEKANEGYSEVYSFNDAIYYNKNNAIEDFKKQLYLYPENYLDITKILTTNLSKDSFYELPKDLKWSNKSADGLMSFEEYQKEVNQQKALYANDLFDRFYQNSGTPYITDGLGNVYEANQIDWAIDTLTNALYSKTEIEKLAKYYYHSNSGQTIIQKNISEIENYIDNYEVVNQKQVNSDELIKTSIFSQLSEFNETNYFNIYGINYYGRKKYFLTLDKAWEYVLNNLKSNYQVNEYDFKQQHFNFKDNHFSSEEDYILWIKHSAVLMNEQDVNSSKEIIIYETINNA